MRGKSAPISGSRLFRTTTGPRRKVSTSISGRSPKKSTCLFWSTTSRVAPLPTWGTKHCCAWPRCRASSASRIRRLPAGRPFALLSGNDDTALAYILLGGHGVISVTANVAPRAVADMCAAALAGKLTEARAINARLMSLNTKLFVEANPIPVKWALAEMGRIGPGLRLPLTQLAASHHDVVRAALREAGCL